MQCPTRSKDEAAKEVQLHMHVTLAHRYSARDVNPICAPLGYTLSSERLSFMCDTEVWKPESTVLLMREPHASLVEVELHGQWSVDPSVVLKLQYRVKSDNSAH